MKHLVTLVLLALCALGCHAQSADKEAADNGMWTTQDSWFSPAPKNFDFKGASEIPRAEVCEVVKTMWPYAQSRLEEKSIVPLAESTAQMFLGRNVKAPEGTKPFLMRAVYLNPGTGGFSVYQEGTLVVVSHGSLGHRAVPMERSALVVYLETPPTELFAQCSMAG